MRLECSCRSSPERSTSSTGGRRAGSGLSSAVSSAASVGRPCAAAAADSRCIVPRCPLYRGVQSIRESTVLRSPQYEGVHSTEVSTANDMGWKISQKPHC